MRAAPKRRAVVSVACLALAVVCCACGSAPADHAGGPGQHGAVITVASFDFPESVLLADIYADALTAQGFPVRILPDLGPRELVDPALMSGLVQVVPEYSGSAPPECPQRVYCLLGLKQGSVAWTWLRAQGLISAGGAAQ